MIGGILSGIHPDDIISLNQLHGDKRGVVRVSMKSEEAAKKLDRKVSRDRRHYYSRFKSEFISDRNLSIALL